MKGFDLFSGAGGMSLGAYQAGIDVVYAIENDPHAAKTYLENHKPGSGIFNDDIRAYKGKRDKNRREPLVLFGGPPCQGFSTSNQRTRTSENPNNWLFKEFIRVVKIHQPEWVVFENVRGILETEAGSFVERVLNQFSDIGYSTSYAVLNSRDFGVPQNRSRFFIVANNAGEKYEFPNKNTNKAVTVKQAFQDLPLLTNGASSDSVTYRVKAVTKYAKKMRGLLDSCTNNLVTRNAPYVIKRYKCIPQGGNWENIPLKLMGNYQNRNLCHTGIYRRLKEDEPSVVIGNFRKNMLIHPTQDRGLSVREAARLQSFPDWFQFHGSIGFQQQQVGNAVPPLLAEAIFRSILDKA